MSHKFITNIFQKYISKKDINYFNNNFFYFIFFRLVRKFLTSNIIVKIYNFYVYASNKKTKTSYALLNKCGFDDKAELRLIRYISEKNKIFFVDCGCNFGFYSLFVASLSKENLVKSFEASIGTINDFKKNIELNNFSNIEAKNFAISNLNGQKINFFESENDWESSITHSDFKEKKSIIVNSTTIDNELKNLELDKYFLFIKLDIEGHEFNALKGSLNIISKYQPFFQIELSKYNLNNKEFNFDFFENFLIEYDYCVYDIFLKKTTFEELQQKLFALDKFHNTIGNYYLVKRNSRAEKYLNLNSHE